MAYSVVGSPTVSSPEIRPRSLELITTPAAGTHATKRPRPIGGPCPYQQQARALEPWRQHPPDHQRQGEVAIPGPATRSPAGTHESMLRVMVSMICPSVQASLSQLELVARAPGGFV